MFKPYYESSDKEFILFKGDCRKVLKQVNKKFDLVFADPPYFLSSGGNTIHSGKIVSVEKGHWDVSKSLKELHRFNKSWLKVVQEFLTNSGTIWVSGTNHNIFSIIQAIKELEYKLLNVIVWEKTNPPPNFYTKIFKQSVEYIVFARKSEKHTHKFNYDILKTINDNKRMTDVWKLPSISRWEKKFGKHPTQKPLNLLARIILSASDSEDLILDPFTGSSTTGIAANILKRNFIGIDTEDEYLRTSVQRRQEMEKESQRKSIMNKIKDLKKLNQPKFL